MPRPSLLTYTLGTQSELSLIEDPTNVWRHPSLEGQRPARRQSDPCTLTGFQLDEMHLLCTLQCMLYQTRQIPLSSQSKDKDTPMCMAALENYPYLAYPEKKNRLRHPYPAPPSYRNFWSGEGTLASVVLAA